MLVAQVTGVHQVELVDRPDPSPLPGTAVVEISRCGVSGADLDAWRTGRTRPPAIFGHEWVGQVVEVGAGVTGRFEGERVVHGALPPCGRCRPCVTGHGRYCTEALDAALGLDPLAPEHGGFARRIRVDARRLVRLPEGLDDDDATLAPPASVAGRGVASSGQRVGDLVAVVGSGTIGLLTVEMARLAGARRVVVVEPDPERRELACSVGADAAFGAAADAGAFLAELSSGLGADVVYECAGGGEALARAVDLVRRGGHIVVSGFALEPIGLEPLPWLLKELTVSTHVGFGVDEMSRTLDLLAEDRLRVGRLHRHRTVTLGELPELFVELAAGRGPAVKTLVAPQR